MTGPLNQLPTSAQAVDKPTLNRHFGGGEGLLPLWIAEPYVDLAPEVKAAVANRAGVGWFGYETRPNDGADVFWSWMKTRHQWDQSGLRTLVSPSVGTSIGVLLGQVTAPGDGVILQPPVFTDFKPLVTSSDRQVVRNPLVLTSSGYRFDLEDLEKKAMAPSTTALILCNPHNPVGRVWKWEELSQIAEACARHNIFVIADEIHADLTSEPHPFIPFAAVAATTEVRWAALHGPIKTFGLAGICDTFVITNDDQTANAFESVSSRLHLTRNNVFSIAASHAAYSFGGPWVDNLLELTATNANLLSEALPDPIRLIEVQGTYLAWLDFRELGLGVLELSDWLSQQAQLALSLGHWFGREGAGFARMTIAAPTKHIEEAINRLERAIGNVRS